MSALHDETTASSGSLDPEPSLGRSDDGSSAVDSSWTVPATPSDRSPFMSAQAYSIPPTMDSMVLPFRVGTPQPSSFHAQLPDIMDPRTAANVHIRHVCCIGAGYVGMFRNAAKQFVMCGADTCNA